MQGYIMKYEPGKIYDIKGTKVFVLKNGDKVPQCSPIERNTKNIEFLERIGLTSKFKTTDYIEGVYYSRSKKEQWTNYYIDENFNGLSKELLRDGLYFRICITSIVVCKITNTINAYFKKEHINEQQEIEQTTFYNSLEIPSGQKMTDKAVIKLAKEILEGVKIDF